jgi:phage nucleotide-binding protein
MPAVKFDDQTQAKWRILIYGAAGVGKSTMASTLPGKSYLLSLDDSYHRIDAFRNTDIWAIDPDKPVEDLADFVRSFDPSNYDNLIIDNVSNLQKLWFVEMAKQTKSGLDNQIQHYGEWTNYVIRFIAKMFSYDLNVFVTAWELQTPVTNAAGQEFQQYGPDLRSSARDYLMGNCDIVGRMIAKPQTGERGFILVGDDGTYAKNRLDNRKGCKAEELLSFADSHV